MAFLTCGKTLLINSVPLASNCALLKAPARPWINFWAFSADNCSSFSLPSLSSFCSDDKLNWLSDVLISILSCDDEISVKFFFLYEIVIWSNDNKIDLIISEDSATADEWPEVGFCPLKFVLGC